MARKRRSQGDRENEPLQIREKPRVDMAEELAAIRLILQQRGFAMQATGAAGEIWLHRGVPWRITLLADPDGTLRAEIRDPAGGIVTEIRPATPDAVEAAMPI